MKQKYVIECARYIKLYVDGTSERRSSDALVHHQNITGLKRSTSGKYHFG